MNFRSFVARKNWIKFSVTKRILGKAATHSWITYNGQQIQLKLVSEAPNGAKQINIVFERK